MGEINKNNDFDNSNIFEELAINSEEEASFGNIKNEIDKDKYYYLSISINLLKGLNYILLTLVILLSLYIYVQGSINFKEKPYLDFICPILLGEAKDSIGVNCSGLESFRQNFSEKLSNLKNGTYSKITPVLQNIYNLDETSKSKDVFFLIDKTQNRVMPTKIIEAFDKLKNSYYFDKNRIVCNDIIISEDNILKASCFAYASEWDNKDIIGYDGKKNKDNNIINNNDSKENNYVSGTSRAVAISFLNYIEVNSDKFTILNRQKIFSIESTVDNLIYTFKTRFNLELKYNGEIFTY